VVRKKQPRRPKAQRPQRVPASNGLDPLAPLTDRGLRREANTLADLQYRPQERELAYRRQVQAQRQANVPGWFQDYRNTVGAMQQHVQQAYQAGQQAAYQQANAMYGRQAGAIQQQGAQAQADAAKRGTTADSSVQAQALQGAAQNQAMGTAFGGLIGAQGANQGAIYAAQQSGVAGQQLQAQQNEQAQMRKLDQLAADLASDKGAFRVKARGDLREQERAYDLNRRASWLNVAQEQNDAADAAAQRRLKKRQLRSLNQDRAHDNALGDATEGRQGAKDRRDAERDAYQREHGLGPYKPAAGKGGTSIFSPKDIKRNRGKLRNFIALGRADKDLPSGYDPLMAGVAAQLIKKGVVDRKTSRRFREAYGFSPRTLPKQGKVRARLAPGAKGQGQRPN
jgi:hypothetical protein